MLRGKIINRASEAKVVCVFARFQYVSKTKVVLSIIDKKEFS